MLVRICIFCRCRARQQDEDTDEDTDDDSGICSTDDNDMLHTGDMITFRNSMMLDVYEWIKNNISATKRQDCHLVEDIVIQNDNI